MDTYTIRNGHFMQKCIECGAVVAQCRCMTCDKTVTIEGRCSKCVKPAVSRRRLDNNIT